MGLDTPPGPWAPGFGRGSSLDVSPEKLDKATGALEDIHADAKPAGDTADAATLDAKKNLNGWETAGALQKVLDEWQQQVDNLRHRLTQDAAALRGTSSNYKINEGSTSSLFAPAPAPGSSPFG
ncbi:MULTISPECIES: hypothetical protein [Streptomyces]|uniref:hypothetical protein n=1 Tax=Streptomyces TaxID=1883 RepID=UPI0022AA9DB6|nr:hypothetical protein [Streptomyces sp. HB2AG]MCZ2524820.1 hypothetical protein [Streptomyces sp. HB2AG]